MQEPENPDFSLSTLLSIIDDEAGSKSRRQQPPEERLEALKAWRDALLHRSELERRLESSKRRDVGEAPVVEPPAPPVAEPLPALAAGSPFEAPITGEAASPLRLAEVMGEPQTSRGLDLTRLAPAREVAQVGSATPEFPYYGPVRRFFARIAARSVLFLAGIVTAHQRLFNNTLLDFATESGTRLSELGARLDRLEKNASRLADAAGAAIYEREARAADGIQQLRSRLQGLHTAVRNEMGDLERRLRDQVLSQHQSQLEGLSQIREQLLDNEVQTLEHEHRMAGYECDQAWLRLTEVESKKALDETLSRHEALAEDLKRLEPVAEALRIGAADHEKTLRDFERRLADLEPLAADLATLAGDEARRREVLVGVTQRLERLEPVASEVTALTQGQRERVESIARRLERLETRAEEADALEQRRAALERTEARFDALDRRLEQLDANAERQVTCRDLEVLAERMRSAEPASKVAVPGSLGRDLDAFYLHLEDRFRGSRELIKERLEAYLPLLADNGLGTEERPVLDVGCGRGEWLELLADRGFVGRGVEINEVAASDCRELGLNVATVDALSFLRDLPANKLGVVTAFHVIEHVPFEYMIGLFDETLRVLQPGGMALFETPNPENVVVASTSFHCDPTHRNPIHPEVLVYSLQQRGFADLDLRRLTESRPDERLPELEDGDPLAKKLNPVISLLNKHLAAPADFLVIGRKPR